MPGGERNDQIFAEALEKKNKKKNKRTSQKASNNQEKFSQTEKKGTKHSFFHRAPYQPHLSLQSRRKSGKGEEKRGELMTTADKACHPPVHLEQVKRMF